VAKLYQLHYEVLPRALHLALSKNFSVLNSLFIREEFSINEQKLQFLKKYFVNFEVTAHKEVLKYL
jgi:hypothetical protein